MIHTLQAGGDEAHGAWYPHEALPPEEYVSAVDGSRHPWLEGLAVSFACSVWATLDHPVLEGHTLQANETITGFIRPIFALLQVSLCPSLEGGLLRCLPHDPGRHDLSLGPRDVDPTEAEDGLAGAAGQLVRDLAYGLDSH